MKRLATILTLVIAACSTGETQTADASTAGTVIKNPFRGTMQDRSVAMPEAALFVEKCSMCHRQMGMGTVLLTRRMKPEVAMLESRNNLTPQFVTIAVRQGIGNMPRISRAEVSDKQLKSIASYLSKGKPR